MVTFNFNIGNCVYEQRQTTSSQLTFALVRSLGVSAVIADRAQVWLLNALVHINARNCLWPFLFILLLFLSLLLFLRSFFLGCFWGRCRLGGLVHGETGGAGQAVGVVGAQASFASDGASFITIVNVRLCVKKLLL